MKRLITSLLIALYAISAFSQPVSSKNFNRAKLHYSLSGSANGISININLDQYLTNWIKYITDPNNIASPLNDRHLQDNLMVMLNPIIKMQIQNDSDKSISLNPTLDKLVLSNGETQIEFDITQSRSSYPSLLLKKSKQTCTLVCPWDAQSAMYDPQTRQRAMVFSSLISGLDQQFQGTILPGKKGQPIKDTLDAINTKIKDQNILLFGSYIVAMESIEVPLYLVITEEEK